VECGSKVNQGIVLSFRPTQCGRIAQRKKGTGSEMEGGNVRLEKRRKKKRSRTHNCEYQLPPIVGGRRKMRKIALKCLDFVRGSKEGGERRRYHQEAISREY